MFAAHLTGRAVGRVLGEVTVRARTVTGRIEPGVVGVNLTGLAGGGVRTGETASRTVQASEVE